jgi:hypothetical protein
VSCSPPHAPHGAAVSPPRPPPTNDAHDLAEFFGPALHAQTQGRLSPIEWFRTSHQRGGAATGFATWTHDDGTIVPVMVKLPVGPVELRWSIALGTCAPGEDPRALPCPRLLAGGGELGAFDLGWLVTERLEGGAIGQRLGEAGATHLLEAVADFQVRCERVQPQFPPAREPELYAMADRARELARAGAIPESQRWNEALRRVQKAMSTLRGRWEQRSINAWCHGDVHPGNAIARRDGRACVLVDLALVYAGHWIEDALYLERQYWGHEALLGVKPLSVLARLRRERGLSTEGDYASLAHTKRVLAAAAAPAMLDREGNAMYLHAALDVIDKSLPQAGK